MRASRATVPVVAVPVPVLTPTDHRAFPFSSHKRKQILHEILTNPYRLCSVEEIAVCVRKNKKFVGAARACGAPFPGGVSRPEWLLAWLQANPEFDLKNITKRKNGRPHGAD